MQDTDIEILSLNDCDKDFFLDKLKSALYAKFSDNLPENYGEDKPWSLMSLIKQDKIDTYQLLYFNDTIWTGSGGIVREFNNKKVYQAMFRGFSCAAQINHGLGMRTPTFEHCLNIQIDRAKINNCDSVILSFNDYNQRLYKMTKDYTLPKTFPAGVWESFSEPIMFNDVEQWLLIMKL